MARIQPFRIAVPDTDLADLKDRLQRTRWPDPECVDDWSQGIPLPYTRELASYWANEYDWRTREAALNRFDQYTTEIDDLEIHFIHQRSARQDAFPLIITHGWPGSIVEFHKVIEPLNDAGFDVVCPSLPGYGFSGKPTATGWGVGRIAEAWDELMVRLGYQRYGAQGGDWGAAVTTQIGRNQRHCVAIHTNMPFGRRPKDLQDPTRRRGRRPRASRLLPEMGFGLLEAAVDAAADAGLRPGRLAGRTTRLDRGEVLVMDGL